MVRGSVKTARWAVAAFLNESRDHEYQLEVSGGPMVSASAAISVALSNAMAMSVEYRVGPQTEDEEDSAQEQPEGEGSTSAIKKKPPAKLPRNQCVFLSRYKIRYRKFFWPGRHIQAAAGPSDLGGGPPHDNNTAVAADSGRGKSRQVEGEGEGEDEKRSIKVCCTCCFRSCVLMSSLQDPVDALLDYILAVGCLHSMLHLTMITIWAHYFPSTPTVKQP